MKRLSNEFTVVEKREWKWKQYLFTARKNRRERKRREQQHPLVDIDDIWKRRELHTRHADASSRGFKDFLFFYYIFSPPFFFFFFLLIEGLDGYVLGKIGRESKNRRYERKLPSCRVFSYTSMAIISHRWRVDFHCNIYRRIKDRLEIQVSLSLRLAYSSTAKNREIWKQKYVPVRRGYNMDLHLK